MANLTILNNQEVLGRDFLVYGDIENPLFSAKDVAEMIDNKNVSQMLNAVDEDEKTLYTIHRVDGSTHKQWFLTEYGLYEVLMQSRKPVAKQFKKEVKAILKQLRQSGVVITESATQEAIDYQSRFGTRRIRQTFRDTTNARTLYEEFYELSKQECKVHHTTNKDRISASKIIISELQRKINSNDVSMRASEKMALQELISDIQHDITRLSNKLNGGIKSNKTKQLNKLEEELSQWRNYAEEIEEYYNPERLWTTVDYHGFTCNKMYENGCITPTYNWWIENFPVEQIPTKEDYELYQGVDFTKPIRIELKFVKMKKYDTDNLIKSSLDMIFNRILGVDDNIVLDPIAMTVGFCDSTDEGKIIFAIYNTDVEYGA